MSPEPVEMEITVLAFVASDAAAEALAERSIDKLMDFDEIEQAAVSFGGRIIGGSKSVLPPFTVLEPDEGQS